MTRAIFLILAFALSACGGDGPDIRAECDVCGQADEVCRAECEPDYDTCLLECAAEDAADQPACEAECDTDLAVCPDECDVDLARCNAEQC
ncbi:MAG: hypothetical protein EP330_17080 [Deltaproteobacteria bacterium]|nr:MAG: hypothetical protein EP330_17080 [Deltaproteobacteria bacterium]